MVASFALEVYYNSITKVTSLWSECMLCVSVSVMCMLWPVLTVSGSPMHHYTRHKHSVSYLLWHVLVVAIVLIRNYLWISSHTYPIYQTDNRSWWRWTRSLLVVTINLSSWWQLAQSWVPSWEPAVKSNENDDLNFDTRFHIPVVQAIWGLKLLNQIFFR